MVTRSSPDAALRRLGFYRPGASPSGGGRTMIAVIALPVALVAALSILAYRLATFALPVSPMGPELDGPAPASSESSQAQPLPRMKPRPAAELLVAPGSDDGGEGAQESALGLPQAHSRANGAKKPGSRCYLNRRCSFDPCGNAAISPNATSNPVAPAIDDIPVANPLSWLSPAGERRKVHLAATAKGLARPFWRSPSWSRRERAAPTIAIGRFLSSAGFKPRPSRPRLVWV